MKCKSENTSIDQSPSFWDNSSEVFKDVGRYKRLIEKLIYLTISRPDISYAVGLLSQFMHEPKMVHWQGALGILGRGLIYEKHGHLCVEAFSDFGYASNKGDRKSTSSYCTYISGNLVTWRSKK